MTAGNVVTAVQTGQAVGDEILELVQQFDPGVKLEAGTAEVVLNLAAKYVAVALNAWSQASGQPITVASITALLPDSTPLSAPDVPDAPVNEPNPGKVAGS